MEPVIVSNQFLNVYNMCSSGSQDWVHSEFFKPLYLICFNYISAPKNIRAHVINEEFSLRREKYEIGHRRDEELHKLKVAEREWLVKAAEEQYEKARLEKESAEEQLKYNRAKRELAELQLNQEKKNIYCNSTFLLNIFKYVHWYASFLLFREQRKRKWLKKIFTCKKYYYEYIYIS